MGLVAKAFQDIITFSRASSGTYVNSNGYITNSSVLNYLTYSNQPENAAWTKSNSFVQTNLLLQSQTFDDATWTKAGLQAFGSGSVADATIAPNGTITADKIVEDAVLQPHYIAQSVTTSATVYAYSVYLKAAERSFVLLWSATANFGRVFDLSTGAVSGTVVGVTQATATIDNAGNGWYRCTIYGTCTAASNSFRAYVMTDATTFNYTGNGTSGVYIWGAQLVQGSVPGDYRATTTAALPCLYADYNGALRARKVCETSSNSTHSISQSITTTATPYTFSKYYKQPADGSARRYVLMYHSQSNAGWVFDLQTGTAGVGGTTGVNAPVSYAIVSVGGGWYRCQIVVNATAASNAFLTYLVDNNGSSGSVYTGDGSSGIYIADAQLNDGSSALAYYDTTASAYNAPRFDYDPVTLAAKGLLVEESRANLLTYSDGTIANLTSSNNVTNATTALNPSFTNSIQFGDNTIQRVAYKQTTTTAATAYTLSVFVRMDDNSAPVVGTTITSGDFGLVFEGSLVTAASTVTAFGNNTHRVQATVTAAGGAGLNFGVIKYTGQSVKGFRITGFQLEAGAFATSYIPTVASQVTRAGDFASVNTLSPWFNSVAGTLYAEFDAYGGTNANRFYEFAGATSSNTINGFLGPSTVYMEWVTTGGAPQAQLNAAGSPTAVNKVGAAYKENDFAASLNGATPVTDAGGTIPVISTLYLGNSVTGSQQLNGHLRRITYYPRRLTNAELQSITTL